MTGFLLVILFSGLYLYLEQSGSINTLFNQQSLQQIINDFGQWGPILIIIFMSGAIVMSPLPSAPIALASGAAYGHVWGTIYILIGAELGAIIAFSMARMLGHDVMKRRFGDKIKIRWLQSDNHLMLAIGISRLIPFISFDIVSYAAGLTSLGYLRFALATLFGITPASYLLAHFGSEMANSDLPNMIVTILLLGGITVIPLLISLILSRRRNR
ncbi:MAG TPA: TVP38/TMEM64 family protein [Gammaproteobacteria bacterium]|nr:TVP38/TMEM64 family protein [Gammaproteobacteria bacterium]